MNRYSFDVSTEFAKDVNHLAAIREEVKTEFSDNFFWEAREARISNIVMKSASAFTVSFNYGTLIAASKIGSEYVIEYTGTIDFVVFSAAVTLTELSADWEIGNANHRVVEFSGATGSTFTVTDGYGRDVYPTDTNKYELTMRRQYQIEGTASGYNDLTTVITYEGQAKYKIPGQIVQLSSIAVTTAPTKTEYLAGETFDADGMEVTATFADSTTKIVTDYTYAPDGELATTDTEITITYTDEASGVTKTATQEITVTEPVPPEDTDPETDE